MPGRSEYGNTCRRVTGSDLMKLYDRSHSSSVSPRAPAITSTPMKASGISRRIMSMRDANRAVSYRRFIRRSTASEPDCSGMWKCGMNFRDSSAIHRIISSESRLGSIDEMR